MGRVSAAPQAWAWQAQHAQDNKNKSLRLDFPGLCRQGCRLRQGACPGGLPTPAASAGHPMNLETSRCCKDMEVTVAWARSRH